MSAALLGGLGGLGTWLLATTLAAAPTEVHTATRDVRDCLALSSPPDQTQTLNLAPAYAAATDGGLVLLDADGRVHTTVTRFDGLPETRSYVLEPAATLGTDTGTGTALWVGTEGGLARVELEHAQVTATYSSAPVRAVIEDAGHVFVGTWGEGVFELRDGGLQPVSGLHTPKADRITDLMLDGSALVVASAGAGAWVLAGVDTLHASNPHSAPEPIPGVEGMVWTLAEHGGHRYAGTFTGLLRLDGERVVSVSRDDVRVLVSTGENLHVGTRGQGASVLRGTEPGRATLYSRIAGAPELDLARVQGMDPGRCLATPEGLWIRSDSDSSWRHTLDRGLPSGDITALVRSDLGLFAATFDGGLARYDGARWQAIENVQLSEPLDPQINALAATPGSLWVATARGLYRLRARAGSSYRVESWTKKQGLPHDKVLSLATTESGELLVGTQHGVVIIDAQDNQEDQEDQDVQIEPRALGSRAREWATWAVAEGRDGDLWLGTTQGLIHWHKNGRWTHMSMLSNHLSDNWVTALEVTDERVYVGTYAGGVVELENPEGSRWTAAFTGGGRVNPGGLSVVDSVLYAATMKGLLVRADQRWKRVVDAAPFEDVTVAIADGGDTWVGSRRGLAKHDRAPH